MEYSKSFKEEVLYTEVIAVTNYLERDQEIQVALSLKMEHGGIYLDINFWLLSDRNSPVMDILIYPFMKVKTYSSYFDLTQIALAEVLQCW